MFNGNPPPAQNSCVMTMHGSGDLSHTSARSNDVGDLHSGHSGTCPHHLSTTRKSGRPNAAAIKALSIIMWEQPTFLVDWMCGHIPQCLSPTEASMSTTAIQSSRTRENALAPRYVQGPRPLQPPQIYVKSTRQRGKYASATIVKTSTCLGGNDVAFARARGNAP